MNNRARHPDESSCVSTCVARASVSPSHMKSGHLEPESASPSLLRSPQDFTSQTNCKPEKKCCRLICWCISKNHCRFYSIIYASVVCIKDGLNYHAVSFCTIKKWPSTIQQFHDTTSKFFSNNLGQLHLSHPEATSPSPAANSYNQ